MRVVGVNTAIISPSGTNAGIGFAIPIDVVNRVVPQLIRTGHVPTPGIGIVAANEAVATRLGVEGVVIVRTVPGSPAARVGLRGIDANSRTLGDVIVNANNQTVRHMSDLTDELEQVGVGNSIKLTLLRAVKKLTSTYRSRISAPPNKRTIGHYWRAIMLSSIAEIIRDLLIFVVVMAALLITLVVVISKMPDSNPLKRLLTALR